MRLTRLTVDAFKVVKRAEIDFGPNLNILYGPNDLGKSTLATAIRAALLVPPNSSEAHTYTSWFGPDNPRVELTLIDADGHYWKVKKTFGTSSTSAAELLHSKDGLTFAQDCRARQVEEKLRDMLAWGIPSPGGRGGQRGAPRSFLASVLLAEQTETDDILRQSLTEDADESGKLRLTKALSALAQDPLFKEVLGIAQAEYDRFFTESGSRKRGRDSQFKKAGELVKSLTGEIDARKRQLEESAAIEEEVNALREARSRALAALDEASANLAAVERRFKESAARAAIAERLVAEEAELVRIDAQIGRLEELQAELTAIAERVKVQEGELAAATAACDAAEADVRAAEEAHRVATSDDSAREQELRKAQLSARVADLSAELVAARGRQSAIDAAMKAREEAKRAEKDVGAALAALEKAREKREDAVIKAEAGATELENARAILAFIRWRAAVATIEEATRARDAESEARRKAAVKDEEASAIDVKLRSLEESLLEKSAKLPAPEQGSALRQLERDLEKAEAVLGGGISVAVRPAKEVSLRATVDQQAATEAPISAPRVFEADRTLRLSIDDLVEIDVTAGRADDRRAVEALRLRWQNEALPVIEKAGVKTRSEIELLVVEVDRERAAAADLKRSAERLRAEATALREQAAIHAEKAGSVAMTVDEVEARKSAIGVHDVQTIEAHYRKLGKPAESRSEQLREQLAKEHRKLLDEVTAHGETVRMAEYQLSEARKKAEELEANRAAALSSLPSPDIDSLHSRIVEEISRLEREKAENTLQLELIVADASREVQGAQSRLVEAQQRDVAARERRARAAAALDESRAALNAASGAAGQMRVQIEALDRDGAAAAVTRRKAELNALPEGPAVTSSDVDLARNRVELATREHDRAKEQLNLKEGALSRAGGAALREEVERLEEARAAAEVRERELEVDADAWRLLRDTLREVENEEGAHLGRALAGPVTSRFQELTRGRYGGLRLDAALKAEALEVTGSNAGGDDVLDALSVGTRGQLAALIRLSIADQLRSTIVLDDHLVHTDAIRLDWFRDVLQKTAINAQVIVLTCRAEDYLSEEEIPVDAASRDAAAGTVRAIDVQRLLTRW